LFSTSSSSKKDKKTVTIKDDMSVVSEPVNYSEVGDLRQAKDLVAQLQIENQALQEELDDQRETSARNKTLLEEQVKLVGSLNKEMEHLHKASTRSVEHESELEMLRAESQHLKRLLQENEDSEKQRREELNSITRERDNLKAALSAGPEGNSAAEVAHLREMVSDLEEQLAQGTAQDKALEGELERERGKVKELQLALAASTAAAHAATTDSGDAEEIAKLRDQVKKLEDQLAYELNEDPRRGDISSLQDQVADLEEQLKQLQDENETLRRNDTGAAPEPGAIRELQREIEELRQANSDKSARIEELSAQLQTTKLHGMGGGSDPSQPDSKEAFRWQRKLDEKDQLHQQEMRKVVQSYEEQLRTLREQQGTQPLPNAHGPADTDTASEVQRLRGEVAEKDRTIEELTDQMLNLTEELQMVRVEGGSSPGGEMEGEVAGEMNQAHDEMKHKLEEAVTEKNRAIKMHEAAVAEKERLERVVATLQASEAATNKSLRDMGKVSTNFDWGSDVERLNREINVRTQTIRQLSVKNAQLESAIAQLSKGARTPMLNGDDRDKQKLEAQVIQAKGELKSVKDELEYYKTEARKAHNALKEQSERSQATLAKVKSEIDGYAKLLAASTSTVDRLQMALSDSKHKHSEDVKRLQADLHSLVKYRSNLVELTNTFYAGNLQHAEDTPIHADQEALENAVNQLMATGVRKQAPAAVHRSAPPPPQAAEEWSPSAPSGWDGMRIDVGLHHRPYAKREDDSPSREVRFGAQTTGTQEWGSPSAESQSRGQGSNEGDVR